MYAKRSSEFEWWIRKVLKNHSVDLWILTILISHVVERCGQTKVKTINETPFDFNVKIHTHTNAQKSEPLLNKKPVKVLKT
jgi:hypothetical protein